MASFACTLWTGLVWAPQIKLLALLLTFWSIIIKSYDTEYWRVKYFGFMCYILVSYIISIRYPIGKIGSYSLIRGISFINLHTFRFPSFLRGSDKIPSSILSSITSPNSEISNSLWCYGIYRRGFLRYAYNLGYGRIQYKGDSWIMVVVDGIYAPIYLRTHFPLRLVQKYFFLTLVLCWSGPAGECARW